MARAVGARVVVVVVALVVVVVAVADGEVAVLELVVGAVAVVAVQRLLQPGAVERLCSRFIEFSTRVELTICRETLMEYGFTDT